MAASDDFKEASRLMKEMAQRVRNLRPALRVAAEDLSTFADDRFNTGTAPDGAPWAPLSRATLLARARRGRRRPARPRESEGLIGAMLADAGVSPTRPRRQPRRMSPRALATAIGRVKPLVDTARLRKSINVRIGPNTLTVGSNAEYAGVHQFGGRVPARPYLPIVRAEGGYTLDTRGAAGELWKHIEDLVRAFIRTGEVK